MGQWSYSRMRRLGSYSLVFSLIVLPVFARRVISICGTTGETAKEESFLHRQARRNRGPRPLAIAAAANDRDIGNIAVIEDSGGVVERQNDFNLDFMTLAFSPTTEKADAYEHGVTAGGYEEDAAASGTPLAALDDDDTRAVALPFAFPFFGTTYSSIYVNSDGNLTFNKPDADSSARSLGRMTAGPPRIAPLFDDLNPAAVAGGVRVSSDSSRVVVSWVRVPEWVSSGSSPFQTFQVKLYRSGRIEFSYAGASPSSAVVGIAPGALKGETTLLDFRTDTGGTYTAAVAERFGTDLAVDVVTVAQRFYQTHDDSYDYLAIYNNMNISALDTAVAYASRVRSHGSGWGVDEEDSGVEHGSASRLLSVLNMGPLSQYPVNPNGILSVRSAARDTPLTVLGHEAGHLFLAFASVTDPEDPTIRPMIGYGGSHWSFLFNSEASLLEGERILDQGPAAKPRFITTDVTQAYSPLDRYLMGFAAPSQVPDTFVVTGASASLANAHPASGVSFDGTRRNVSVDDVIQAMGRRTPDASVAQRRFRMGFILVTAAGSQPAAADLARIETYRQQFVAFFDQASGGNAAIDTSLRRSLKLSVFPAAGIVAGASAQAQLTVKTPPTADLVVEFQAPNGNAGLPLSATIPAGATTASFSIAGIRPGVEELAAVPRDPAYEPAYARVQVADASLLKLVAVSGDRQIPEGGNPLPEPVTVRLTDQNHLPYAGARLLAVASQGGAASPSEILTGAEGEASFVWTPGSAPSNTLRISLDGMPGVELLLTAGAGVPVAARVVNAASFEEGIAAGAIQTIQGASLTGGITAVAPYPWPDLLGGVRVTLNGWAIPLLYVSDRQVNFYVPASVPTGPAVLSVISPSGAASTLNVNVAAAQPAIFPDAIVKSGTVASALTNPVRPGDFLEIYCTGLGPTRTSGPYERTTSVPVVFIGASPLNPTYSGLVPGWTGLYQVNVRVPDTLAPGTYDVILSLDLLHSNTARIAVQ